MIVLVNKKRFASVLAVLLVLILIFCGLMNMKRIKQSFYPTEYSRYVENYSEEFGLDKYFVYAIIKAESNFDKEARSDSGAVGLMQIMPDTAAEAAEKIGIENYSESRLSDPEINIRIGCYYLAFLMERYSGDMVTASAAYNAGYGNVDSWLAQEQTNFATAEIIPFGETKKYIVKVENYYNKYIELYTEG